MRSADGDALLMEENYFVEKLVPALSGRELSKAEMDAYRAPYLEVAHRKPARVWPQESPSTESLQTTRLESRPRTRS